MLPRKCALVCTFFSLSACATLDGRPASVITVQYASTMVAAYQPDDAIQTLGSIPATDVAGRNTYRNRVVSAYLTAIDANYNQFLRSLSRSGRGAHLIFDSLLLGLTGAGAIFDQAASELAAAATAAGGVRSSFDRELFADRALPIIISLMDSRRLAVRADILRGLSMPEGTYTLEEAFSDLMRYEGAGTIDGALSDAAAQAGDRAEEAQYDYSRARDLCVVDASTDSKRRALMIALERFERNAANSTDTNIAVQNRQSIQRAALALGIEAPAAPTDTAAAFSLLALIRDQVEAQCDGAGVDALRTRITDAGVTLL